jgi:uncharacterized repeat protein (TIGR02543 family)
MKSRLSPAIAGICALLAIFALSCNGDPDPGGNDSGEYTVTFNANGGTVSPSSIQVESGRTVSPLPTPSKTSGDTFFWGWYTKSGTGGDWGISFTTTTPVTGNMNVYARWGSTAPTRYTITFNAYGGTVTPASKQVNSGDPVGNLPTPTRPNHTFGGWYTAQNGGGTVFTSATIVTGNITVFAKWIIIEQSVARVETRQLTEENWKAILTEIKTARKYINLDLSACTRSGVNTGGGLRSDGTFDPLRDFEDGKEYITSLILPNTTTSIVDGPNYDFTFKGFSNIDSVSAPAVTTIGIYAFRGCTSLTSVNLPSVTNIGMYAFYNCNCLTSVSFPVATSIGWDAFRGCTSLTSVSFPVATNIARGAFSNCTSLTSVSFPAATTIGYEAFRGCTSLTSVSFPALVSFGENPYPFQRCSNLVSFNLIGTGPLSTIEDGKALVRNNTELIAYPSASGITLNTITSIAIMAFDECTSLTSVSFPAVTSIGRSAFRYCDSLTSVDFPAATTIGEYAFFDCTSLTSVDFPLATNISESAFDGCTSLTSVNLPSVTNIGMYAFYNCNSLTSVNFPVVTNIGQAFSNTGTTALTITLGPSAPNLGSRMFEGVDSKTVTVRVPSGATGYGAIPASYSGYDTTVNWGNGFRGGGWNGSGFVSGGASNINSNITLIVQYLE